jgi:virginiamycin B lyase
MLLSMRYPRLHAGHALLFAGITLSSFAFCQEPTPPPASPGARPARQRPPRVVAPGVSTPGVSRPLADLHPIAIFPVEGSPDWSVITKSATWVASSRANHVVQLDAATNKPGLIVDVQRPCSGLTEGFGSIWSPSCGKKMLTRIDPATGKITAEIPADPANSEGGITTGAGSIWMVVKPATLIRVNPKTNTIVSTLDLPSGAANPAFGGGSIWISVFEHDQLLKVNPKTNTIVATIPIGPKPRFLTIGAGSVWTLHQGDGSISRVNMKSGKVVATIQAGLSGSGGDMSFGEDYLWAALFDFPLTQIDPKTNTVIKQWAGQGGDGMRAGMGSIWLSNLRQQNVWRLSPDQK